MEPERDKNEEQQITSSSHIRMTSQRIQGGHSVTCEQLCDGQRVPQGSHTPARSRRTEMMTANIAGVETDPDGDPSES